MTLDPPRRRAPGLLLLLALGAATLAGAVLLRANEEADADRQSRTRADRVAASIGADVDGALGVARTARPIFERDDPSDPQRFADVAARVPLAGASAMDGITWTPRVPAAQREDFEARLGTGVSQAEGIGAREADPRSEYFPVAIAHGPGMRRFLGADESSIAFLARHMGAARDRGEATLSDPLPIGPRSAMWARLYVPVYAAGRPAGSVAARRRALLGFVGVSLNLRTLERHARGPVGTGVRLQPGVGDADEDERSVPLQLAGRRWSAAVADVAPRHAGSYAILAGGLALCAALAGARLASHRSRRLSVNLSERQRVETALRRREARSKRLAEEHRALRRVATSVAAGASPDEVFLLVAEEAAALLDARAGVVTRFEGTRGAMLAVWTGPGLPTPQDAGIPDLPLDGETAVARVYATGRPARVDLYVGSDDATKVLVQHALSAGVAAPVRVAGSLWGAVSVTGPPGGGFPDDAEDRLLSFAELLELAIANADAHERLARQAASDPLTGLANHRVFHERLQEEVARARRHHRPLALALIDLDHFKQVNDTHGHQVGDLVLVEVAARLAAHAREGDLLARVGGEEFAWLMPETDDLAGYAAAERARAAVRARPLPEVQTLTVSAGVCDLSRAADAPELFRLADEALYWAKSYGRDMTFRYSREVVALLGTRPPAGHERRAALAALEALARAVDARDPTTSRHSERVAALAERVARACGWSDERARAIREAALLHDVGKIGLEDAILLKPAALTPEEYERVKEHPALGEQITAGALDAAQRVWVRSHHERWDGRGYPDGLEGDRIPAGASIIAVADAWDVMTSARRYAPSRTREGALEEVRAEAGRQFSPEAAAMLEAVILTGDPLAAEALRD